MEFEKLPFDKQYKIPINNRGVSSKSLAYDIGRHTAEQQSAFVIQGVIGFR